jgi:hypothetical protein
VETDRV